MTIATNYLLYTGMARAGSREGHGDQTPADRRNVQIEGGQEQRNVSGWVDWRQFATVMDAAGTQLSREEMGNFTWTMHQDCVYPSRCVGFD